MFEPSPPKKNTWGSPTSEAAYWFGGEYTPDPVERRTGDQDVGMPFERILALAGLVLELLLLARSGPVAAV
jgi:hypothetical protein